MSNMISYVVSALVFMTLGVSLTHSVCPTPPEPVTPTLDFPTLPDSYSIRSHLLVRNMDTNASYSVDMNEACDGVKHRESMSVYRNGTVQSFIINVDLMEVIVLLTENDRVKCSVKNTTDLGDFSTTFNPLSGVGGLFDTHTISQLLQLIPADARVYQGYINGNEFDYVNTTVWTACVELDDTTTIETNFYFYANPEDSSIGGTDAVPSKITITVEGDAISDVTSVNETWVIESHYSFYTPDEACETLFQPEGGVYCKNRIAPVKIPSISDDFTVVVEMFDMEENFVTYHETFFDYDLQLVRYDEIPITTKYGRLIPSNTATPKTIIHDYNLGLSYTWEVSTGVCSVTNIDPSSVDAVADGSYVLMKHSSELFQLDKYTYQSEVTAHGIDAHRWIVLDNETAFPITASNDAIFQLTFAKNETRFDGTEVQNNTEPLLQAEMKGTYKINETNSQDFHILVNYFNYNTIKNVSEISAVTFDISACYTNDEKKSLHLYFPGEFNDVIGDDRAMFLDMVRSTLATASGVSQLRFTDFWLAATVTKMVENKDLNVIVVGFTLLGVIDVSGDVKNPAVQPTLELAYNKLTTAVDSSTLTLSWMDDTIIAVPDSLTEYTDPYSPDTGPKSTGFSSGAMAGLGIAMFIVGVLGGLAIAWKFWRPAGGFQYQVQA